MQSSAAEALQRLSELAYHRLEWSGDLVLRFYALPRSAHRREAYPFLETACAWLLVPFTLWPIDFHGLCALLLHRVHAEEPVELHLRVLVESLPPLPDKHVQAAAAAHEHAVQQGQYEGQVKAREKYRLKEEELLQNPAFAEAWAAIKAAFDTVAYQDRKGIVRRRIVSERAFRHDWGFDWDDPASRFATVFDAFCCRWNLYGMQGDQPLLQKISVNLTPHGTMIFIPAWWSLDQKRDLDWAEIMRLHRPRAPSRQGAKLTRNQMEQRAEATKAAVLNTQARARGLRGEARVEWVMQQLGWKNRDPRHLRLVLSRAKRLA